MDREKIARELVKLAKEIVALDIKGAKRRVVKALRKRGLAILETYGIRSPEGFVILSVDKDDFDLVMSKRKGAPRHNKMAEVGYFKVSITKIAQDEYRVWAGSTKRSAQDTVATLDEVPSLVEKMYSKIGLG